LIPSEYLGDVLTIYSFYKQFDSYIGDFELTKEEIFVALNYSGDKQL